jgi:pimeloyl-ACP methyl ester carboxylesterase/DNA-binding CsgD family transcriptional regulator
MEGGRDMAAHTRFFTTSGGVRIAYATLGQGPPLVVIPPWLSHLELVWDIPALRAFNEALARDFTVVLYDRYGCGLSDRDRTDFSHAVDVRVLAELADHLRLRRFALLGVSTGALVAVPYALAQPRLQREAASAETALALLESAMREDQLELFPRLRVPTLVMNRRDDPVVALETARDLAARIPGARFAALEGDVHIVQFGDPDPVIAAIRTFVDAPSRRAPGAVPAPLGLSPREVEVLRLLAAGLSNPAIAARLTLSVHTVERHVVNIYTKLGIHGRAEATAYAIRHDLLPATFST